MWRCLFFHEGQFFVIVVLGRSGQHKFANRIHCPLCVIFILKWTLQEHLRNIFFDFPTVIELFITIDTHLYWTYRSPSSSVNVGLDCSGFDFCHCQMFPFLQNVRNVSVPTQPSKAQAGKHLSDARTQNLHNHDTYISLCII